MPLIVKLGMAVSFTEKNIQAGFEATGISPFAPRRPTKGQWLALQPRGDSGGRAQTDVDAITAVHVRHCEALVGSTSGGRCGNMAEGVNTTRETPPKKRRTEPGTRDTPQVRPAASAAGGSISDAEVSEAMKASAGSYAAIQQYIQENHAEVHFSRSQMMAPDLRRLLDEALPIV